jgi:hypothetical protein
MMRSHSSKIAVPVAAVVVALCACSEETGQPTPGLTEGCLNGAKGLDCKAKCVLRQTATGKVIENGGTVDVATGALQAGGFTVVDFSVQNDAAGASAAALRIVDVRISDDKDQVFECSDGSGKVACSAMKMQWKRIAPTGVDDKKGLPTEERFRLRYKHIDNTTRTAKVCLDLVGDPAFDPAFKGKPLCFALQTVPGKALLTITPTDVVFPYVPVGKQQCIKVQVSNTGDAPLTLVKVDLATVDPGFTVTDGTTKWKSGTAFGLEPPVVLAPGKGFDLDICFQASDELARKGVVLLKSDDPAAPLSGRPIMLKANSAVPCLKMVPYPTLNFGAVVLGTTQSGTITLKSCGAEVLEITGMKLGPAGQEHFTIEWKKVTGVDPKLGPSVAEPLKLLPNESIEIPATYTPSKINPKDPATQLANPDVATVDITANVVSKSLQLTGIGVGVACPEPKIVVKEGEQVEPQTVLHLIGDKSIAPGGGTITKYAWTVKSQPTGSDVKFVPGAGFPNPTVQVDAAGSYVFCLRADDAKSINNTTCEPACVEVLVVPSSFLHVELLWKTPLDKNEQDQGPGAGSDMDLHLAHPFAAGPDVDCDGAPDPWFHSVFDCFWFNEKPEWGQAGYAEDDPSLDLDDTDGAGPENINLNIPEGTTANPFGYPVGVHYWNDHGFGESFATVKIYVLGKIAAEFIDVPMKPLDMWYVGKINWPNSAAGGTLPVLSECKATGVPACPSKPAPSKPGKFWDAQGTGKCISPCYLHPGAPTGALTSCKP